MDTEEKERARKLAKSKYQKKYQNRIRNTVKAQLNCTIDRDDFNDIDGYCNRTGISKAALIVSACRYIIDNDIPPEDFLKK